MDTRVNYSGLAIAGIGFLLTRFTVTLAIYEDPVRFYLAGIVPLALGLGLAAFGVALAVADVEPRLVRTTALWCTIGTGTMLVLVVLTLMGATTSATLDITTARSQSYLSNFLIGGSVGGTLTGLYASRTRRQRSDLQQQTNRLVVLNRMLRHEILNAVTAIRGHATLQTSDHPEAEQVIKERSLAIEQAIEDVKYLTRHAGQGPTASVPTDIGDCLSESVETVRDRHPDATVSLGPLPDGTAVAADEQLSQVFTHLLENAVVHARDSAPAVAVTETDTTVRVSVTDDGPGLPESQRALLEAGEIGEFDDPKTGFGLNIVRLFVESYGGDIETIVSETGTTITVVLPHAEAENTGLWSRHPALTGVRPTVPKLAVSFVAAVIAGVFYGIASEALGGSIAGIGVFYGTANPVVGWITHEFHSVVFGFVFVGLLSLAPDRHRTGASLYVVVSVLWALVLWIGAAGIVAPIWLRLLGIPASLPNLSGTLLVSHLVWGISLGTLVALGDEYVTPWLTRFGSS